MPSDADAGIPSSAGAGRRADLVTIVYWISLGAAAGAPAARWSEAWVVAWRCSSCG